MYPTIESLRGMRPRITEIALRYGVSNVRVFGSVARGTAREGSDVDLLVEFEPGQHVGMFGLSRMQIEISEILGRTVDLRTAAELSRYFRAQVLDESRLLYAG